MAFVKYSEAKLDLTGEEMPEWVDEDQEEKLVKVPAKDVEVTDKKDD